MATVKNEKKPSKEKFLFEKMECIKGDNKSFIPSNKITENAEFFKNG